MAHLQSYCYKGWGEWARENLSYVQAIRVGDRIVCSGQGNLTLSPISRRPFPSTIHPQPPTSNPTPFS